jgi:hypothetical protein
VIHAIAAPICTVVAIVVAAILARWTPTQLTFNLTTLGITTGLGTGPIVTLSYKLAQWLHAQWKTAGKWPAEVLSLDGFLRSRTARRSRLFAGIVAVLLWPTAVLLWHSNAVVFVKFVLPLAAPAAALWLLALLTADRRAAVAEPDAPQPESESTPPPDLVAWWKRIRQHAQFQGQVFLEVRQPARTFHTPAVPAGVSELETFRLASRSQPRPHQIEAMRALTRADETPSTLLYQGATGAGKTTAILASAIDRIIESAETILILSDDPAAATRLATLIRDAYVSDTFRSALRIHTLEDALAPNAPGADILVGTWETLHQVLLATRSGELWEFLLNLGLVWIEDGGKLSGPHAGHAAGLLRRLDVLLAGQPPDVALVTSFSLPDGISFMRNLTGRANVQTVSALATTPPHLLVTWQPAVAVITTENSVRRFHLRHIRKELQELCAILSGTFPRNAGPLRLLVYHCDLSLSVQDRQAAVADVAGTSVFAADLSELESAALRTRFHVAVILGSPSRDIRAIEHILGFILDDAPVIVIPSPGVLGAAWLRLPTIIPSLSPGERVVPLARALPLHNGFAAAGDPGLADDADRELVFGDAVRPRVRTLLSLHDLPEDAADDSVAVLRTPGQEPLGMSLMLSRLIDRAAPGLFVEQPECVRRDPPVFERRRYRIIQASEKSVLVEGPHDFAALRGPAFDNTIASITRVTPHLTVSVGTTPFVREGTFARLTEVPVTIVRDGLLEFDGHEDPERGAYRRQSSTSQERVLGGWAIHLQGQTTATALWDVADLLSAVMALVVVPGEAATPLTTVTSGMVLLFDRAGDGATFSAIDPDDDRKLGTTTLLLAYVSLLACPCMNGCSRCLGVFETCRPVDLIGKHEKRPVMEILEPLLRPILESLEWTEQLRDPANAIHDETERYRYIRDAIALPIMKREIDMEVRNVAELTAEPSLGGTEENVIGLYIRDTNEVLIQTGLEAGQSEATVTHEYTHNWQCEDNFPVDTITWLDEPGRKLLREGFAEWVSYKVLQVRGRIDEMSSIELRDGDEYGSGFEFFHRLEQQRGQSGVMDFARNPAAMPADELHRRIRAAWIKPAPKRQAEAT